MFFILSIRLVAKCRQLKQIAEAIYEALPQAPLLFLSQKEAKKLLKPGIQKL